MFLFAAMALVAPNAHAQDVPVGAEAPVDTDKVRARELFENATVLYDEGDYEAALTALTKANELFPNPALQFNIANCLERLGRFDEAIASMNQYRAVAPPDERTTLERRIRALEARSKEAKEVRVVEVPVEAPVPTTTTVKSPNIPLIVIGSGVAVGGIVGAIASKGAADKAFDLLDRSSYGSARTANALSLVAVGVGVGTAALGVVLTKKRMVQVSVQPTLGGARFAIGGDL